MNESRIKYKTNGDGDNMSDLVATLDTLRNDEFPDLAHLGKEEVPNLIDSQSPDARWVKYRKYRLEKWDRLAEKLPELIRLAEIQPNAYYDFCLAVQKRIFRLDDEGYEPTDPRRCDEALLKAERSVRGALDAIMAMNDDQRLAIGDAWITYMDDDDDEAEEDVVSNWTLTTRNLLTGIAEYTGSASYQPGETSKPGRKKNKLRSNVELDSLIRDLWLIAHAHGGGYTNWPELDGRAMGTMKKALELLAPLLPAGFVPKAGLSATRIHKLRPDKNCPK
jgi:hypothetical protein